MLCVYGIVRTTHGDPMERGVHGAPVRVVVHEDVAAVVSELNGELLARRRDVDAHLTVLEQAFRDGDVLPFRFGTVVQDEKSLRDVLMRSLDHYRNLLDQLSGLVQVTVKAVRSDEETVRLVVAENDWLRRKVRRLRGSSSVADQLELGESVASAVEVLTERDAHDITARLSPLVRSMVSDESVPPTVVSLALLLDPDELSVLDKSMAALHDEFGSRMTFEYAGPMPPYSFVR